MVKLKDIKLSIKKCSTENLPPFIITVSTQDDLENGGKITTYAMVTSPDYKGVLDLTRKQAKRLIDIAGLICTLKNKHGSVYDTPEEDFRHRYRNYQIQPYL